MKHLKPYKIFESQEILKASLSNAVENNNLQLIKDMVEEFDLDPSIGDNMALRTAINKGYVEIGNYLAEFPSVQRTYDRHDFNLSKTKILNIFKIIEIFKEWSLFNSLELQSSQIIVRMMQTNRAIVVELYPLEVYGMVPGKKKRFSSWKNDLKKRITKAYKWARK